MLDVRIWRGSEKGELFAYDVPTAKNQTVLDVLTWVQRHCEPALAYRFSCRVGVCGSCAMVVNGRSRWACRSHIKVVAPGGRLVIEPLRHLPRIKDLVCDLTPFQEKWRRVGGCFEGSETRHQPLPRVHSASAERWMRELNASTAQCATAPAMSSPGCRTILDRPLSTVPGHWSTTKGTSVSTTFSTL